MTAHRAVRLDASPITLVAASARTAQVEEPAPEQEAISMLSRDGYQAIDPTENARALPRKMWLIVGAGLVAWAVVAIPAWFVFG